MDESKKNSLFSSLSLGIPVALGLIGLGAFLSYAILAAKAADRYVSVKGLAEKEVEANLVIWPINFKETAADLGGLYQKIEAKNKSIEKFLLENGFTKAEIIAVPPAIIDSQAESYSQPTGSPRFKATAGVTVRSENVKAAVDAMRKTSDLIKSGVAITGNNWESQTEFLYTKLNDIKPEMIESATKNARDAAAKFAEDSGSKVGKIRRASQGLFSIQPIDKSVPHLQKVRVVSTVDFMIEN